MISIFKRLNSEDVRTNSPVFHPSPAAAVRVPPWYLARDRGDHYHYCISDTFSHPTYSFAARGH